MALFEEKIALGTTLTITETAITLTRAGLGSQSITRAAFSGMEAKAQLWRYELIFHGAGAEQIRTPAVSKKTMQTVREILGV